MNWEASILNKIYRTNIFKISTINLNNVPDKSKIIEKLNRFLEEYNLKNQNIRINKQAALYKIKPNKNSFYFGYDINTYFYLYASFFDLEKNVLDYSLYDFSQDESRQMQERKAFGKKYSDEIKNFIFKFLFCQEYENNEPGDSSNLKLQDYYDKINKSLQYSNHIIGSNISHYDIIIFSIMLVFKNNTSRYIDIFVSHEDFIKNLPLNDNGNNSINHKNCKYPHLQRWVFMVKSFCQLDFEKIHKIKQSHYKETLFEGFKLTSNKELVELVMQLKDKNTKNHDNSTPNNPNEDIYKKIANLLEEGENVNSRETQCYKTLAHIACRKNNLKLLKLLIKYDADLESIDFEFMTPLFEALISGDIEISKFLIEEKKVNIEHKEIQDRTPFYWVACNGDIKMVELLIQKGVDCNNKSKMGRTPLSKACWNGKTEVVELLVKIPNMLINQSDRNGRSPLHNSVWGENGGKLGKKVSGGPAKDNPACARILIENGALIEVSDNEGYTPLMIAASTNGVESLKYLIEKGGNVNAKNNSAATALIESSRYGNWECVKVLLEKAKNLQLEIRDEHNMSAIDYAALLNRIEVLDILLNSCSYSLKEYFDILFMSIYARKIVTFEFVLKFLVDRNILAQFALAEILAILEKMIILHQYEKYLIICEKLAQMENQLAFKIADIGLNVDLMILSYLSLKIYNINKEKSEINCSKDIYLISKSNSQGTCGNSQAQRDYDDVEDEIREKIINDLKSLNIIKSLDDEEPPEVKSNNSNARIKKNNEHSNAIKFIQLQNFSDKSACAQGIDQGNQRNSQEVFETNLRNNVIKYYDLIIQQLKNYKIQNVESHLDDVIIPHKFIKLLLYMNIHSPLKTILILLTDLIKGFNLDLSELIEEINFSDKSLNSNYIPTSFLNLEKINLKPLKIFLENLLCCSDIILENSKFDFKYSINKKKKEDNYYANWKKYINSFNNHNALSLSLKSFIRKTYKIDSNDESHMHSYNIDDSDDKIFQALLNSNIYSLYLFTKLKNNKNFLHLIFPKLNSNEVFNIILTHIKNNYPRNIKNIISMINDVDHNNLTPIDIAIKKRNYDMIEVYTKIINEFLNINYFLRKDNTNETENNTLHNYHITEKNQPNISNRYSENIIYKIVDVKVNDETKLSIPENYKSYLNNIYHAYELLDKSFSKKNFAFIHSTENKQKNNNYSYNCTNFETNLDSYIANISSSNKIEERKLTPEKILNESESIIFMNDLNAYQMKTILERNKEIILEFKANTLYKQFQFNNIFTEKTELDINLSNDYNSKLKTNHSELQLKIGLESSFIWVDSMSNLESCCQYLMGLKYIGIDLEYHNYKSSTSSSHNAVVCVIQLSSPVQTFAIDCFSIRRDSIQKWLKPIFESENILKIFHGCDNDLNFLISNFQIYSRNFIDTGRTFLVFQKLILNKSFKISHLPSLNYLAKLFLNIHLEKSYQKSDWRMRPLTKSKNILIKNF